MTERQAAVAFYARVSTEDQAERQTVQAQLEFLRKYCDLHQIPIAGEYVDDGISGTVPLDQRPEGRRLLGDVKMGQFGAVLVYRLDRLGRSLKALIAAHEVLDAAGVAIKSATEPFDTASPIGRFVFNLLGSMAELERSTIADRMSMGRDRVARDGKYTGGPVPTGYDVDGKGQLVPSALVVPELGVTEADMVRDLFRRIAEGSSLIAESHRLNMLGVTPRRRYGPTKGSPEGKILVTAAGWSPSTLWGIIRNPAYRGVAILRSKRGIVERPVMHLVDTITWEAAQATLVRNRVHSKRNSKAVYLLSSLITCARCGLHFTGMRGKPRAGHQTRAYRCNGGNSSVRPLPESRCRGRSVDGDWLENLVWDDCRTFIENPGQVLAEAQRALSERVADVENYGTRRQNLMMQLAAKNTERD